MSILQIVFFGLYYLWFSSRLQITIFFFLFLLFKMISICNYHSLFYLRVILPHLRAPTIRNAHWNAFKFTSSILEKRDIFTGSPNTISRVKRARRRNWRLPRAWGIVVAPDFRESPLVIWPFRRELNYVTKIRGRAKVSQRKPLYRATVCCSDDDDDDDAGRRSRKNSRESLRRHSFGPTNSDIKELPSNNFLSETPLRRQIAKQTSAPDPKRKFISNCPIRNRSHRMRSGNKRVIFLSVVRHRRLKAMNQPCRCAFLILFFFLSLFAHFRLSSLSREPRCCFANRTEWKDLHNGRQQMTRLQCR